MREFKIIEKELYMVVWQYDNKDTDRGYEQFDSGIVDEKTAATIYDTIFKEDRATSIELFYKKQSDFRWSIIKEMGRRRF